MYEFVQTSTGWRVFWGIDPGSPAPAQAGASAADPQEPVVLPFPRRADEPVDWPAA